MTKSDVIPEYKELLIDEEDVVREAAIENMVQLLDFVDIEIKVNTLIPLWKRFCDEQLETTIPLLVKYLGLFLWQTKSI